MIAPAELRTAHRLTFETYTLRLSAALALPLLVMPVVARGEDRPQEQLLAAAREVAQETSIVLGTPQGRAVVELRPEPISSYTDEARLIKSSSLWVYLYEGLPVAFQKVEDNHAHGKPQWTCCLSTCGRHPATVTWGVREAPFVADAATFRRFDDESPLADSLPRKRLQMRSLARRTKAMIVEPKLRATLRLLPTPLLEYESPENGVTVGAVFGFANGTNPDALLAIEYRANVPSPGWYFTPLRMTAEAIRVAVDEVTILDEPHAHPGDHGRWCYFLADQMETFTR